MSLIISPGTATVASIATLVNQSATNFDAAVAYATFTGAKLLVDRAPLLRLPRITKRFLVGIDWFRSEPSALDALDALDNLGRGNVKVVDGDFVISSATCQPRKTYHPKAYSVTNDESTLIVGSANLSANGLSRSIELSLSTSDAATITDFQTWFDTQWRAATPWARLRDAYAERYTVEKRREFVITDDDDVIDPAVLRLRWVTPERLRLLRTSQNLWSDVGRLHNRDLQGLPGTDMQFTQMTRVFFGYPARIVPGNTPLLDVPLSMTGATSMVRPLMFNRSSSMDRISLPVPGERGWPARYDDETLLFTKASDRTFLVTMATGTNRARWKRLSQQTGFCVAMQRTDREWGVF